MIDFQIPNVFVKDRHVHIVVVPSEGRSCRIRNGSNQVLRDRTEPALRNNVVRERRASVPRRGRWIVDDL